MLTILGNLRINSQTKLDHFKDSFLSFQTISDNWVINVRGEFRDEAICFLREHLGDKLELFELLDESRGWTRNTQDMMGAVKYEYLLLWNEEQVNLADPSIYKTIVCEMSETHSDYLMYSWWLNGKSREIIDTLPLIKKNHIDVVSLTKDSWKKVLKAGYEYFLISLIAIYKKDFFLKIMERDSRLMFSPLTRKNIYRIEALLIRCGLPLKAGDFFWFVNRLTGYRIPHWSSAPPFNIEKHKERFDMLPFVMALPKQELFACIDDDLDQPGYQLIKRGLYPPKSRPVVSYGVVTKESWGQRELLEDNDHYRVEKILLNKNSIFSYVYYEDFGQRTEFLPRVTIIPLTTPLTVSTDGGSVVVKAGETVSLHPNRHYSISTSEDVLFYLVFSSFRGKVIVPKLA